VIRLSVAFWLVPPVLATALWLVDPAAGAASLLFLPPALVVAYGCLRLALRRRRAPLLLAQAVGALVSAPAVLLAGELGRPGDDLLALGCGVVPGTAVWCGGIPGNRRLGLRPDSGVWTLVGMGVALAAASGIGVALQRCRERAGLSPPGASAPAPRGA
jgi:hypothetical protein